MEEGTEKFDLKMRHISVSRLLAPFSYVIETFELFDNFICEPSQELPLRNTVEHSSGVA